MKTLWVTFALAILAFAAPLKAGEDRQPQPIVMKPPMYPQKLFKKMIPGSAIVEFTILKDGTVCDLKVIQSSRREFEAAALDAVMRWRFKPGMKDGRAVNVRAQQRLEFEVPSHVPVYPFIPLMAGRDGTALVNFWEDENKELKRVVLEQASDPIFGKAAVAMLEAESASVAQAVRKSENGMCRVSYTFKRDGSGNAPVNASARGILKLLKKPNTVFLSETDLDQPLVPLAQMPPLYPLALREAKPSGTVVVEYFIDHKGEAQLPRVLSETREEFGYAAVQAVGQWRFDPPLKNGKPVIVRTQVALTFDLRDEAKPETTSTTKETQP